MKAIVQSTYGSPDEVLDLQDIAKPVVGDGEVLVRVHAASVHLGDWILITGVPRIMRDGTYPLSATSGAIEHVAEGHARGTAVITI